MFERVGNATSAPDKKSRIAKVDALIERACRIENGFKDIEAAAKEVFDAQPPDESIRMAIRLLKHDKRQVRCIATFLLGHLAATSPRCLEILRWQVSRDPDWRVQEILAKAFDRYCSDVGYEAALLTIEKWLADSHPNVRRAVTEGLRVWTGRAYFKDHPSEAIRMLSQLRADDSEYLCKSVGNALHDIGKAYPDLVREELARWDKTDQRVARTYRLASRTL